jgi:hypothetical protein
MNAADPEEAIGSLIEQRDLVDLDFALIRQSRVSGSGIRYVARRGIGGYRSIAR